MYSMVELDGTVSLVVNGHAVNFVNVAEVREGIRSLVNVLFEAEHLKRLEVCDGEPS